MFPRSLADLANCRRRVAFVCFDRFFSVSTRVNSVEMSRSRSSLTCDDPVRAHCAAQGAGQSRAIPLFAEILLAFVRKNQWSVPSRTHAKAPFLAYLSSTSQRNDNSPKKVHNEKPNSWPSGVALKPKDQVKVTGAAAVPICSRICFK